MKICHRSVSSPGNRCVSSWSLRPESLPFSTWLVQTPRLQSIKYISVSFSFAPLAEGKFKSKHHPRMYREFICRNILPITNNIFPHVLKPAKTSSKTLNKFMMSIYGKVNSTE